MTAKERSFLRGAISKESAILQIGKGGLSDNLIASLDEALTTREVVKITILKSCDADIGEICGIINDKLCCETVCTIGNKAVFYRLSKKPGIKHIL